MGLNLRIKRAGALALGKSVLKASPLGGAVKLGSSVAKTIGSVLGFGSTRPSRGQRLNELHRAIAKGNVAKVERMMRRSHYGKVRSQAAAALTGVAVGKGKFQLPGAGGPEIEKFGPPPAVIMSASTPFNTASRAQVEGAKSPTSLSSGGPTYFKRPRARTASRKRRKPTTRAKTRKVGRHVLWKGKRYSIRQARFFVPKGRGKRVA